MANQEKPKTALIISSVLEVSGSLKWKLTPGQARIFRLRSQKDQDSLKKDFSVVLDKILVTFDDILADKDSPKRKLRRFGAYLNGFSK